MSGADETLMQEIIGFLESDREDLSLAATEAVLGISDRAGIECFIRIGGVVSLSKLSSRSTKAGTNALGALLNLSSKESCLNQCIDDMINNGAVSRMVEIALSPMNDCATEDMWRKRVNVSLALLTNMTRIEKAAVEFCGRSIPDQPIPWKSAFAENGEESKVCKRSEDYLMPEKPTVLILLAKFLSATHVRESRKRRFYTFDEASENLDDPYQHFATVLMNATQVEQGRMFMTKIRGGGSLLEVLLPQLRSNNPVRRQGIAGSVKNCCFEKDSAWWLLNEVKILKYLLYPLAGPEQIEIDEKTGMDPDLWLEGPDKLREPDHDTRLLLVESILLLCATGKNSRRTLRLARTYVILKLADMVEESEEISDKINECVQFLRRDEEGEVEGSSDRLVEDVCGKATSEEIIASPEDNYDCVD